MAANTPRFLGIHLRLEGQRASTALDALMADFPTLRDIQCFTNGPRGSKKVDIDVAAFKARVAHHNVRVWTHGSYICIPWSPNAFLTHHTLENIRLSHGIGSRCVVVHLPMKPVNEVVTGIIPLVKKMRAEHLCGCKLMLETSATRPDPEKSYETPAKLNRLTDALVDAGLSDCVQICVDSAHIATSRAAISSYAEGKAYCDALDTRLLGMIQLNGNSIHPDVAYNDRHEVPLSDPDLIWGPKAAGGPYTYEQSGCKAFVDLGRRLDIPIILEVNKTHTVAAIRTFIDMATADAKREDAAVGPLIEPVADVPMVVSVSPGANARPTESAGRKKGGDDSAPCIDANAAEVRTTV